jgi:hypothetical protein
MKITSIILLAAVLLFSCGRDLPKLNGIDLDKWKDDRNACSGYRTSIAPSLNSEMAKLKGLSEMDVIRLLGKPEQNELYKRNQKFYSYFISPGGACQNKDSAEHKLILRFNAMGYAQLVSME